MNRFLEVFIPTQRVKVTPVIISANVLIYLIMVVKGVSPLWPSTEDVRAWGATNAVDVTAGEYWRLWTSNYLHYGIIHLAVNMLSLNNVGRMLEQFIGAWRFALIYTATGIFASAVSIWWNPFAVGVGASGAILGIVGILLAILTTPLIEKSIRFKMLRSMAFSAGLMIIVSFQANVDNAAHLGGLASGMLCGYFIFPELKAFYHEKKTKYVGLIASILVVIGVAVWFVVSTKQIEIRTPQEITADFEESESNALQEITRGNYKTADDLEKHVIPVYTKGLLQIDTIEQFDLNEQAASLYKHLRKYCEARKKQFEFQAKYLRNGNAQDSASAVLWDNTAASELKSLYSK